MTNRKKPSLPTRETISHLMQQATQMSYFSFFCLPGFFIIALTAIPSSNLFLQNNLKAQNAVLSYIPLVLGGTFLLALLMSLLAMMILFSSGELKKQIAFFARNPRLESEIKQTMKRLRFVRKVVVSLFVLAAGTNIALTIATLYFH